MMVCITDYYVHSDKVNREIIFASLSDLHLDLNKIGFRNLNLVKDILLVSK